MASSDQKRRPRLLVLNEYYWPGVEATAHLLTDLCEALADDFDVTVVTGLVRGHENEPRRTTRRGVHIVRVASTAFDRARLTRRAANYATYLGGALLASFRMPPPSIVLCMTDPPMVGAIGLGLARRFRVPLVVVSQDVFPEVAVELGRLQSRPLTAVLRVVVNLSLRGADAVVAIGETMRRRLIAKGADPARVHVIPNWVDTKSLVPQPRDNEWARSNGLVGKFVVMHSGNVGHAQDLDALVRSATFLRDLDDLEILIVGFGARWAEVSQLAERLEAGNVRFLEYQPREVLSQSLSSADVHFVGLGRGLSGYVVPSRLYGILSVGRPVLVAADSESETAQMVSRVRAGIVVEPGRPERVAAAIRELHGDRARLREMGELARAAAVAEADRVVALARYKQLLEQLL